MRSSRESEFAISVEDALRRIKVIQDYDPGDGPCDCVHTQAQSAGGMLIGAHWSLESAESFMREHGVEEAGNVAQSFGHGLVTVGDGRIIFWETT